MMEDKTLWGKELQQVKSGGRRFSDYVRNVPIFGRPLGDYIRNASRFPDYVRSVPRCFQEFRQPLRMLWRFIAIRGGEERIELTNNLTLHLPLPLDPYDAAVAYAIWAKREYGGVPRGGVVVDIGAHIGIFALFAAAQGASKIYSFEPSRDAFGALCRNVQANGLGDHIIPARLAVTERDGDLLPYPTRSSIHNTLYEEARGETEEVATTTLARIVEQHGLDAIDLLKLDCEGAEYGILYGCSPDLLRRIRQLKMEYHRGATEELIAFLGRNGLQLTHRVQANSTTGILWFEQSPHR